MNKLNIILSGIVRNNPTFVLVLGMCPTLGTTTSAGNGMGMGLATMAVLIMSNLVISLIKNIIPDKVRNPAANASYADAAFVANRFVVVQRRYHI